LALVVLTGGARSGKSSAAQRLAENRALSGHAVTVAVFGRPSDSEMEQRISRHRDDRPDWFETREICDPVGWTDEVDSEAFLVVDCLGTMLGLLMERSWNEHRSEPFGDAAAGELPDGYAEEVGEAFRRTIDELAARSGDTLVVTNEVGLGVVPEWASGRLFRDLLGQANRSLVNASDAAYLVVAGRLIDLKASPAAVQWPED